MPNRITSLLYEPILGIIYLFTGRGHTAVVEGNGNHLLQDGEEHDTNVRGDGNTAIQAGRRHVMRIVGDMNRLVQTAWGNLSDIAQVNRNRSDYTDADDSWVAVLDSEVESGFQNATVLEFPESGNSYYSHGHIGSD
ncbi:hypothetical protein F4805DRAFT_452972 [Annulohypoxylon moriforme]|nr:hypothetical protein F4805DRAFT_452972 [Annulohypoxylon moriforme]